MTEDEWFVSEMAARILAGRAGLDSEADQVPRAVRLALEIIAEVKRYKAEWLANAAVEKSGKVGNR